MDYLTLIEKTKHGDRAASHALYADTVSGVYYSISRFVSRKEDIEDLVQDTYVTAFSHLHQLSQPQAFPKWIHRIAANTAKNYLKKQKPQLFTTTEEEEQTLASIPAVGEDFLPEEYAHNKELRRTLIQAINALPEKQRTAMYLYYYEDFSLREMSNVLEVGESTIKSRLNAGRATLRTALKRTSALGSALSVLAFAMRTEAAEHHLLPAYSNALWTRIQTSIMSASAAATASPKVSGAAAAATGATAKAGFLATAAGKITAIALSAVVLIGGITGAALAFGSSDSDSNSSILTVDNPEDSTVSDESNTIEESSKVTETSTEDSSLTANTPAPNLQVLTLAGQNYAAVQAVYGNGVYSTTMDSGSDCYLFDDNTLSYVFAYGEENGCNYITGTLAHLISNCPDVINEGQLYTWFPNGYTEVSQMDMLSTFCFEYNGCTVVIYGNGDGTYSSDALFYFNCDSLTAANLPTSSEVASPLFAMLGHTKPEIDALLGVTGSFDGQYQALLYNYEGSQLIVYMNDYNSGTCIGFSSSIEFIVDMAGKSSVSAADLEEQFGPSAYNDPWAGESSYTTIYNGAQLRIFALTEAVGEYVSGSPIVCCLLGEEIYPDIDAKSWYNSNSINYANITIYSRSASSLVCDIEYGQITAPYKVNMVFDQTFTSTDGITYTASNVEDGWGSICNLTLRFENDAAYFTYETVQLGEMANFAFGEFVVYP